MKFSFYSYATHSKENVGGLGLEKLLGENTEFYI